MEIFFIFSIVSFCRVLRCLCELYHTSYPQFFLINYLERYSSLFIVKITIRLGFLRSKIPMGLDKGFSTCLNIFMYRLPSSQLGNVIRQLTETFGGFASLLGRGRTNRVSPQATERMRFERDAFEQFVKLKEKGLSIPVFTL